MCRLSGTDARSLNRPRKLNDAWWRCPMREIPQDVSIPSGDVLLEAILAMPAETRGRPYMIRQAVGADFD